MPRRVPELSIEAIVAGLEYAGGDADDATTAMLDATSSLLASYGLRRWTVEDVAERAGLGRATVYRRFESRDELVHAALGRDARRFFAAVAKAVANLDTIEDKVVEGFLVGWAWARQSVMGALFASDPAAALSLLTAAPLLDLARAALLERYRIVTGRELSDREATDAALVAEALVRLGLSFVLIPGSVIDLDRPETARQSLRRLLEPLISGRYPPSKRTSTSSSAVPRTTRSDSLPSSPTPSTADSRSSMEPTGLPAAATIRSPRRRPAEAAGLPSATSRTSTPSRASRPTAARRRRAV
jgi:AcrR family transcriptional regulator